MTPEPIDAVITWVDGDDQNLRAKREKYLKQSSIPGAQSTRFASVDEVIYCVLSIMKHATFFRNIFIVTDNQTPPVFDAVQKHFPEQAHKIKVINHTEIFRGYEKFLPTFNSTTIIMQLHKIPNIAEKFVFFNDDFFVLRPLTSKDFFIGDSPVLRGGWMGRALGIIEFLKLSLHRLMHVPIEKRRLSSKKWMLKSAQLAGIITRTFIATHTPYAMRQSTILNYEVNHPKVWQENIKYRFRDADQFVTESLAAHLEIKENNAQIMGREQLVYIRINNHSEAKVKAKLQKAENNPDVKFLCIQNLDQASQDLQNHIQEWLKRHLI